MSIHPTAIVHPGARLADGVQVGAYSIIGEHVEIGEGSWIGPHVVVEGHTKIGRDNRIFQFCSIGSEPQDKKYAAEPTRLEIGDGNTIREYVTINRGTADRLKTAVGANCLLMAYVHLAHDCILGNNIVIMKDGKIVQHSKPEDIVLNPANDYVRAFVAHTNPLNVLRGRSLMRPLAECAQRDLAAAIQVEQHQPWGRVPLAR